MRREGKRGVWCVCVCMCLCVLCRQMAGLELDLSLWAPRCVQDMPPPPHTTTTHMDQTSENVGKDQLGILAMHSPAQGGECGRHFGEGWPDGPSSSCSRWPFSEACGLIPTDYF